MNSLRTSLYPSLLNILAGCFALVSACVELIGLVLVGVIGEGTLLYWQARAVSKGQSPKYTNPAVSKTNLLYVTDPSSGPTDEVVVTEDILSCIRVGRHTSARSILGTKTSDTQAAKLASFSMVAFWLDPDAAGDAGAHSGRRKMSLVTASRQIVSSVDPKNLSDRAIRNILQLPPTHKYKVLP